MHTPLCDELGIELPIFADYQQWQRGPLSAENQAKSQQLFVATSEEAAAFGLPSRTGELLELG